MRIFKYLMHFESITLAKTWQTRRRIKLQHFLCKTFPCWQSAQRCPTAKYKSPSAFSLIHTLFPFLSMLSEHFCIQVTICLLREKLHLQEKERNIPTVTWQTKQRMFPLRPSKHVSSQSSRRRIWNMWNIFQPLHFQYVRVELGHNQLPPPWRFENCPTGRGFGHKRFSVLSALDENFFVFFWFVFLFFCSCLLWTFLGAWLFRVMDISETRNAW